MRSRNAALIVLFTGACGSEDGMPGPGGPDDVNIVQSPPVGLWMRSIEGVGSEGVRALSARPGGELALFGYHGGSATFSPGRDDAWISGPESDSFLIEYATDGGINSMHPDPLSGAGGHMYMAADGTA